MRLGKVCRFNISILLLVLVTGVAVASEDSGHQFTSLLGFNLGLETIADVKGQLGSAAEVVSGDASEYEASVCYTTSNLIIKFIAGEMSGPDRDLSGFSISKKI